MFVDFIYDNPTWLWGSVFISAFVGIACAGLAVFTRFVSFELRGRNNESTQAVIALVGTAYAVLLAFVAVAAWQSFTDADKIVDAEASLIGNLHRDTTGLAPEKAQPIRAHLESYVEQVVMVEWPLQQQGAVGSLGWRSLEDVHALIARLDPQTLGEFAIQAELLRGLNSLYGARRTRILASGAAVPLTVWVILTLGTVLSIGYTYVLGIDSLRLHYAMTASAAIAMALVFVLILALDRPFRGELSVSTEAYENVRANMARLRVHEEEMRTTPDNAHK
jgi:hypothetical protein